MAAFQNSPVGSPVGRGTPQCTHYDLEAVAAISKALIEGLAAACVEKTAGKMLQRADKAAPDVKRALLDYLNKTSEAYEAEHRMAGPSTARPLEVVEGMLDDFVSGKRNLMSRLSKKATKNDKADALVPELERQAIWPAQRREYLAEALIARTDAARNYHCGGVFGSQDELVGHMASCNFRPVTCPNAGCGRVITACRLGGHDGICPHKPLACAQGCTAQVPRGLMQQHCNTVCDMKVVACPFQRAGCREVVHQGDLQQHCDRSSHQHLLLIYGSHQNLMNEMATHSQRLGIVEKNADVMAKTMDVEVRQLKVQLKEAETRIKSLEAENKVLHKEVKNTTGSLTGELSQLKRDVKAAHVVANQQV